MQSKKVIAYATGYLGNRKLKPELVPVEVEYRQATDPELGSVIQTYMTRTFKWPPAQNNGEVAELVIHEKRDPETMIFSYSVGRCLYKHEIITLVCGKKSDVRPPEKIVIVNANPVRMLRQLTTS